MKVPYIYVNGKCLNDEFENKITKFEFSQGKLCVCFAIIENGMLRRFDRKYYSYDNDIKLEFKEIQSMDIMKFMQDN